MLKGKMSMPLLNSTADTNSHTSSSENSYFFITIAKQFTNSAYSFISNHLNALATVASDIYQLKKRREEFIFSELYQRAHAENITWVNTLPLLADCSLGMQATRIYVITGTRENIMQVADYGEANFDQAARDFFDITKTIVGRNTLPSVPCSADYEKNFFCY